VPTGIDETGTLAEPDLPGSSMDVAVHVAVPALEGVSNPVESIVPSVAVHVTLELKLPVPLTVALHWVGAPTCVLGGLAVTVTDVMVGGGKFIVIVAEPDLLGSCTETALQLPVPVPDGVKTPEESIVPSVALQFTALVNAPVPLTVTEHCDV
jgi:hypothetical protein